MRRRVLRDLVLQRIEILRELSFKAIREGDVELALTAGNLIFRLAMRNSIDLPRDIKRSFCRKCRAPLIPGLTATIRLRSKGKNVIRIVTCHICWNIHRLEMPKK
ncbi:MAG: ribonuclease P Rpr2/Rpp21/SNM1 subunit [Desulfurococcales archaeon]|nr:ribonuclease P Rpr2/Rpp21/SNM1 subunit [Desulfurococcales archaeon]